MNVTFRKIKNESHEYILIINSNRLPDNIIMYFELNIYYVQEIIKFINKLQKYYNIEHCEFKVDTKEINIPYEIELLLKSCPF